jgi:hypothetical protein
MPKINHVAKAQKDQGTCSGCGAEIKAGDPYKWIKFRFGGRKVRCGTCKFKDSDLTQSEFLSQVYDLNDRITGLSDLDNLDDLQAEVEDLVEGYEALADECYEKKENMPEGLQEGEVGQLLEERSDGCREVADNLQGIDFDFSDDIAREEALEQLDTDDVHLKDLTGEVVTRLREEAKENAERDKDQTDAMDEAAWYTELSESYVEEGLDPDEFEEKVVEIIDEKRQEKFQECLEEAQLYSYKGQ